MSSSTSIIHLIILLSTLDNCCITKQPFPNFFFSSQAGDCEYEEQRCHRSSCAARCRQCGHASYEASEGAFGGTACESRYEPYHIIRALIKTGYQSAANIGDHMNALRHKYTQSVMGGPSEDIFRHTSIDLDKGPHDVPVENFLNAQCEWLFNPPSRIIALTTTRFQHHCPWNPSPRVQSRP